MLLVTPNSTGGGMGAPDTSGIDLDNVRCWAELVSCLRHLRVEAGRPSYSKLDKFAGGKLPSSTLSNLIGEKAETRSTYPEWETVRLFVLACDVPEAELDGWWAAWKAAVAPDRPTCQEERQHLRAKIDQLTADLATEKARTSQLTTDLAAAKARIDQYTATVEILQARAHEPHIFMSISEVRTQETEAVLASRPTQSSVLDLPSRRDRILFVFGLPEPLDRLRVKAEIFYNAKEYAYAADLYKQIATQVEHEYTPGHSSVLDAQRRHLEIETEAAAGSKVNMRFRVLMRRKLNTRWRHLICEYQRRTSEDNRKTFEVRLEHAYWVAVLLNRGRRSTAISHARKLLIDLYADCKSSLPLDDPFAAKVAQYADSPDEFFYSHPKRHWWKFGVRPQQQAGRSVFRYGDTTT
jgi:hypothetical protein